MLLAAAGPIQSDREEMRRERSDRDPDRVSERVAGKRKQDESDASDRKSKGQYLS